MSSQGRNQGTQLKRQLMTRSPQSGGGSFVGVVRVLRSFYWLSEKVVFHVGRHKAEQQARHNAYLIQQGQVSGKLQDAKLGTLEDARALGMTQPFCGVYLGSLDGVALFSPWDFHINTCGLAGSGKSTTLAIPNIISLAMGETPESVVVFDLKDAELCRATFEGRHALDGLQAITVAPWGLDGQTNTRINIFSDIADKAQSGALIVDDALAKIRTIFGDPDKDGVNAWIKKDAMRFSILLLIFWATDQPDQCKPSSFWDFATLPHKAIVAILQTIRDGADESAFIYTMSKKLLDQYGKEKTDQFEWVMQAMQDGFSLFGKESVLREATETTDFDFRLLKQRPQAVYIVIPDTYVDSHGKYIALLLDYIITTIAKAEGTVRTTILADEFSNFPKVQVMLKALRLYRSKLIRIWTFSQDRNGYNAYKEDGGHRPFEDNAISLYWSVTGQHAKELEARAGYRAEIVAGHSSNAGIGGNTGSLSSSEQLTPILSVHEISQLVQGKAILDAREKLFVIDRLPWWKLDFVKPYIRNDRTKTPPSFEEDNT